METFYAVNDAVNGFIWGPVAIIMLLGTGLFLGVRYGFPQFAHLPFIIKHTIGKAFGQARKDASENGEGDITSFQAAMTAIAAVCGSGNIAGVATAVVLGGPGALFWMWVAAFVGMCTKMSEITLGVKYRVFDSYGNACGGPMYYLANGLGQKWLGAIYALLAIPAGIVISAVVDTNSMTTAITAAWDIPPLAIGIFFIVITAIVIIGGISRIGAVCEWLAPFMGGLYIVAGLIIVFTNLPELPHAIGQIVRGAFCLDAELGGAAGMTLMTVMRFGFARGIFSNEAGLGTAGMVHASAKVKHPMEQGIWGATELWIDTLLVCTVTGLTVVMSGLWTVGEDLSSSALTMAAFNTFIPGGKWIVLGAMFLFGYSCLITWYYEVERAMIFLFGDKTKTLTKILWLFGILVGSLSSLGFVWDLTDTLNGLMMLPNLVGLLLLSGTVAKLKKEWFSEQLSADRAAKEEKRRLKNGN